MAAVERNPFLQTCWHVCKAELEELKVQHIYVLINSAGKTAFSDPQTTLSTTISASQHLSPTPYKAENSFSESHFVKTKKLSTYLEVCANLSDHVLTAVR